MANATPSFSSNNNVFCHRCRSTSGTGSNDPPNHLCVLDSSLYVARVYTPNDLFDNYMQAVGGFTLPVQFLETGFTNFPCPIEMISTSNGGDFIKVGHGCATSGPYYVYLRRDGTLSMTYYRVNGTRISSRNLSNVSAIAIHYNRPTASATAPPPSGFAGFTSNSGLPQP